jgi:hypothetical protein
MLFLFQKAMEKIPAGVTQRSLPLALDRMPGEFPQQYFRGWQPLLATMVNPMYLIFQTGNHGFIETFYTYLEPLRRYLILRGWD